MCVDEPVSLLQKSILLAVGYNVVTSTRAPGPGYFTVQFPDERPLHKAYKGRFSYAVYESEDDAWEGAVADHQAHLQRCH